jgi:hypothetical protein
MIRVRSAFLILLIGCLLSFGVGLQAGYFSARRSTLVNGMKKWVEGVVEVTHLDKVLPRPGAADKPGE